MAKLTARGHTILARWRKDWATPDDDLASERTREYAVRSDGTILVRNVTRFRSHPEPFDQGWKVYGRAKKGRDLLGYIKRLGESLAEKGFEEVDGQ